MAKNCNFNTMHPFVTKRVHFSGYWAIVSELNGRKNLIIESLLQWYSSKWNATIWGWFVSLLTVAFFTISSQKGTTIWRLYPFIIINFYYIRTTLICSIVISIFVSPVFIDLFFLLILRRKLFISFLINSSNRKSFI